MNVRIKRLHPEAKVPVYKTAGSAGCDLCSTEAVTLEPGERKMVKTGIAIEIPKGYECQVRPRSGLALRGVVVFNSPGTVDSDFRGEMQVLLHNVSDARWSVTIGDRIAQLVFAPVTIATFELVDELSETHRGVGGWGSTGT